MTALPPDPYQILGVAKDAQIPEIRSAHRKLVLKCHPDKVQDPTLKAQKQDEFQRVQRAYELLSDDNERSKYDDQVKLAELRRQFQSKANISSPRVSPKYSGEYEVRTAEPRSSSFQAATPPMPKAYTTYSRSWEDEIGQAPHMFPQPASRSHRREQSYADRPSKRESEREREREKERDRERDRDRERRRRDDTTRRSEKDAKDAKDVRRAEKKLREKARDKEIKRESEEKKRHTKPYADVYDDEPPAPKSEKKKSSSRRYDDRERDRSAPREEVPQMPPPPMGSDRFDHNFDYAASYIQASRAKSGAPGLTRSATYHVTRGVQPPAAPTPPPVANQASAFPVPDEDDVRRSSARAMPRRGSGDGPRLSRERSYRNSSREDVDPVVLSASPQSRHPSQFSKSASGTPVMPSSPPRRELPRTHTMPVNVNYSRSPGLQRAQTFSTVEPEGPGGRHRSRLQPQVIDESDSDEVHDRRAHDRKHRSSRRTHSPEQMHPEQMPRYQVDSGGRTKPYHTSSGYSRHLSEAYPQQYYTPAATRGMETRPSMPVREASYAGSSGPAKFPRVKTSKAYSYDDIQYSNNHPANPYHREEFATYA